MMIGIALGAKDCKIVRPYASACDFNYHDLYSVLLCEELKIMNILDGYLARYREMEKLNPCTLGS